MLKTSDIRELGFLTSIHSNRWHLLILPFRYNILNLYVLASIRVKDTFTINGVNKTIIVVKILI